MVAKLIWSIFTIYQLSRIGSAVSVAKSSYPSSSKRSPVPSTYSLNRTASKFKGFEHDNYSKTSHSHSYTYQDQYMKPRQKSHSNIVNFNNIKPKVKVIPQSTVNINDDYTFGSISISGLFHSIIVLLLSLIGTCIFLDYQQRKIRHSHSPLPTTNTHSNTNISNTNISHSNSNSIVSTNKFTNKFNNNNNGMAVQRLTNTQIILDYDDTLFPTSYTDYNINNGVTSSAHISKTDWYLLHEICNNVSEILLQLIELYGAENIAIVTNAKMKWLNDSCIIYNGLYFKIRQLILKYNIRVISATDEYKCSKLQAFMNILRNKYSINKVICIGDSEQEYNDIETVCNVLRLRRRRIGKNIINYYRYKLLNKPNLNTMIKQLKCMKLFNFYNISKQKYDQSEKYEI